MATSAFAGNTLVPGNLESYSTIYSIGIEWSISGDDNHNATCNVQYRLSGSGPFLNAKPLYRVDFQGLNTLAGSILFLEPNQSYEVKLTLSDPDGGGSTMTKTIATKPIPSIPSGGNTYHVTPGNGGGNGTIGNPFKGIPAAQNAVAPGDICLLHGGNYGGPFTFANSGSSGNHIVWQAAGDGDPIIDGVRVQADFLWFDGIRVDDQEHGIRSKDHAAKNVVVMNCKFNQNERAIYLYDGGECWYIVDNIIVGNNNPDVFQTRGEGVDLWHTSGHTVAYNTISRVADGISYPHKNVDIFNNDIFDTSDDGIELDYSIANNRLWRNRITNPFNYGISAQPQDGAPYYVIYNQVSVRGDQGVLKLVDRSDRALIAHNTFIISEGPVEWGSQFLNNFEIKNNLWISIKDHYVWSNNQSTTTNWKTDFDHDGFDWGGNDWAFKWDDQRLENIVDFYNLTGQESNGIKVNHETCFDSLSYSIDPINSQLYVFERQYNVLNSNCNAKDAGVVLVGINEDFLGSAPDLGAYEIGQPLPHYGARASCSIATVIWQGSVNGHWYESTGSWTSNNFPGECDEVMIPTGSSLTLQAGQTSSILTLDLQLGVQCTIEQGAELSVKSP